MPQNTLGRTLAPNSAPSMPAASLPGTPATERRQRPAGRTGFGFSSLEFTSGFAPARARQPSPMPRASVNAPRSPMGMRRLPTKPPVRHGQGWNHGTRHHRTAPTPDVAHGAPVARQRRVHRQAPAIGTATIGQPPPRAARRRSRKSLPFSPQPPGSTRTAVRVCAGTPAASPTGRAEYVTRDASAMPTGTTGRAVWVCAGGSHGPPVARQRRVRPAGWRVPAEPGYPADRTPTAEPHWTKP